MIKLGELFCGPGGFAEGAKKAKGFKHVWANDIHEDSCKTFEKHHPGCKVVAGDVYEEFIGKEMRKMSKNIDGLLFGFPCNDFSIVGKKRGLSGKYGPLYKAACEVLDYFKPKFFVAENVSSMISSSFNSSSMRRFSALLFSSCTAVTTSNSLNWAVCAFNSSVIRVP